VDVRREVQRGVGKDGPLRAELSVLEQRQATLLTAAVEPLDLHSVDLARASIRLFEVTHELDEASRANIKGCALSAVGE